MLAGRFRFRHWKGATLATSSRRRHKQLQAALEQIRRLVFSGDNNRPRRQTRLVQPHLVGLRGPDCGVWVVRGRISPAIPLMSHHHPPAARRLTALRASGRSWAATRRCLFDSHRLRQIAWLIDVTTPPDRQVVGDKLHRDRIDQGREHLISHRNLYQVVHFAG